jgi:cytosine/adenosine deaminase-related metal-dependent hydrolase
MTDPASAVLFCGAGPRAEYTMVAGRVVVEQGRLVGIDEEALFHRANRVAERMLAAAETKLRVSYRS